MFAHATEFKQVFAPATEFVQVFTHATEVFQVWHPPPQVLILTWVLLIDLKSWIWACGFWVSSTFEGKCSRPECNECCIGPGPRDQRTKGWGDQGASWPEDKRTSTVCQGRRGDTAYSFTLNITYFMLFNSDTVGHQTPGIWNVDWMFTGTRLCWCRSISNARYFSSHDKWHFCIAETLCKVAVVRPVLPQLFLDHLLYWNNRVCIFLTSIWQKVVGQLNRSTSPSAQCSCLKGFGKRPSWRKVR